MKRSRSSSWNYIDGDTKTNKKSSPPSLKSTIIPSSDSNRNSSNKSNNKSNEMQHSHQFNIRTITAFVKIQSSDFITTTSSNAEGVHDEKNSNMKNIIEAKIESCAHLVQTLKRQLESKNYVIQTVRLATNPFAEFLMDNESSSSSSKKYVQDRLNELDSLLEKHDFQFCSLGPSNDPEHTFHVCPMIVQSSPRLSCSANVRSGDIEAAKAAAVCIQTISQLGESENDNESTNLEHVKGGLGNFRFCSISSCDDFIPFFPGAKCESIKENTKNNITLDTNSIGFAIGLENGELALDLLSQCQSISKIKTMFGEGMLQALQPIQEICEIFEKSNQNTTYLYKYLGIDNSLNPSLSQNGSVAQAMERLSEVRKPFGGQGTLAAAAEITSALQSLPLLLTGYCGLMLPVCEDQRLSELGMNHELKISQLLCISSVCGVGVDTVPIAGDVDVHDLQGLILDVAALAGRWDKSLSCRVFPVPGLTVGETTTFDSPYLCNSRIFTMK